VLALGKLVGPRGVYTNIRKIVEQRCRLFVCP
jgi:hypothetical protein